MATESKTNGPARTETRTERAFKNLNPLMAAVIGVFVLILFCYAILITLDQLTTAPVAATETQEAYSSFDRAVQVVGLISPVLTIVLGFYFGARAGAGEGHAAAAVAAENLEVARSDVDQLRNLIAELKTRGGDDTRQMVDEIAAEKNIAVPPPASSPDPSKPSPPE